MEMVGLDQLRWKQKQSPFHRAKGRHAKRIQSGYSENPLRLAYVLLKLVYAKVYTLSCPSV